MVISVNQLSIYGAVADMIEECPVGQRAPWKPAASGQLAKQEILTQLPLAVMQANDERQGIRCKNTSNDLKNSQKVEVFQTMLRSKFESVEIGQFFFALLSPREDENQVLCREYRMLRDQEGTRIKGWIRNNVRFGPVSDMKVCNHWSLLFSSVNSIQSYSLSRSWWSSPLWPRYWWKQEEAIRQYRILVRRDEAALRQCCALVNSQMDFRSGKRWRTEDGFNIAWIRTIFINSCTFVQFKNI